MKHNNWEKYYKYRSICISSVPTPKLFYNIQVFPQKMESDLNSTFVHPYSDYARLHELLTNVCMQYSFNIPIGLCHFEEYFAVTFGKYL